MAAGQRVLLFFFTQLFLQASCTFLPAFFRELCSAKSPAWAEGTVAELVHLWIVSAQLCQHLFA